MARQQTTRPTHLPLYEGEGEIKIRAWGQLARAFSLIQRRLVSALAGHDLTLPQFDVLATLRFSEGVNQQELARRLLVTKGNVCGIIGRLEHAGWVERRPDPDDGRAHRLRLTAAGKRKIDAVFPDHDALVLDALRTLSTADAGTLRGLLKELARANGDAA